MWDNRVYEEDAVSFNGQLWLGSKEGTIIGESAFSIPKGIELTGEGTLKFSFYAPCAKSVTAKVDQEQIALSMQENGIWNAEWTPKTAGYKGIIWEVDGTEVLNPMAPVGFGWSRPMNYVDIPDKDEDFYLIRDVPHGIVAQEFYFSGTTGAFESCMLYLPPDYMENTQKKYPVLYLQHGHGENEKCWTYQGKVNFIMDNLVADGKALPCIIVMNNGMVHTKAADGTPMMDSYMLEDVLLNDCIPFIEARYRVHTDKEHRAMAGLSMGSMQTSIITMKHPELFSYVGVFSGFMKKIMDQGAANRHLDILNDKGKFESSYKLFMRAMGTEDQFIEVFEKDNAFLGDRGLLPEDCAVHKIFYYPGGHEWCVWRRCIRDFLTMVFQ